jgi:ubiquinone/menaquinone biosynthesis C-methylase UbiE
MGHTENNRFQEFFKEEKYILLKNYLYNYLLRKIAVEKNLKNEDPELILEVGSGISPMIEKTHHIIYSDLSFTAIQILRNTHKKGLHVVTDCTRLPFKSNVFSHTLCSEVLEHIPDDMAAIKELARVMKPAGRLIITFPHRKFYFTIDDRFVKHYRRYEISEMENELKKYRFKPISIKKILGPLEKVTMCVMVICFFMIQKLIPQKHKTDKIEKLKNNKFMNLISFLFKWSNLFYMWIVWLDARIMPRNLSTVLLMKCALLDKPKQQVINKRNSPL